jgi:hypothetical protein
MLLVLLNSLEKLRIVAANTFALYQLVKSSRMVVKALQAHAFPHFSVIYDESTVCRRQLMVISVAVDGTMHCLPCQQVPDADLKSDALTLNTALLELDEAASSPALQGAKPSFVQRKSPSATVMRSLQRALARFNGFHYTFSIPPHPYLPLQKGERREKSSQDGIDGHIIVNIRTGVVWRDWLTHKEEELHVECANSGT